MKTIDQLRYEFGEASGGTIEDYVYQYMQAEMHKYNKTIDRLEDSLSEAVEIMGAIYDNVDKYHLDFAFAGGECYDRLKEYLGV